MKIIHEKTDGHMWQLIQRYYEAGHAMRYLPLTNILVFEWRRDTTHGGYDMRSVCMLDQWFTEGQQAHVFDLIYPRL